MRQATDDDGDSVVNDGCPRVGSVSEIILGAPACADAVDSDPFDTEETTPHSSPTVVQWSPR